MKSIIALFLIVAAALCVSAQQPHCLSNQFTANILLMDPKKVRFITKHFDDIHNYNIIDVFIDASSICSCTDVFQNYDKKIFTKRLTMINT